jgi:hypothetical protein
MNAKDNENKQSPLFWVMHRAGGRAPPPPPTAPEREKERKSR